MKRLPIIPTIIGTGFGSGFWPWGPGTAGSLLGMLIWYALSLCISTDALRLITIAGILLFTWLGTWATKRLEPFWGDDPKKVVVDEIVGIWIPLLAVSNKDLCMAAVSLLLFRFFDILKPLGIRAIDRKRGAFYVMADDIVAGMYSLLIVLTINFVLWAN